ncbi:hypothetical protein [Arthrobacter sp. UM1]|uniref:hypothetical protein n=1 Tax=Arthrobacter sp. UM1 TaxID=2766776 RepID=UPI001CF65069|nr:hypothetical protein [Arthrobacter sp. UM1]MCB4209012.1 hypothetical protein [Arthrobacter sp. UM1]
MRFYVKAAPNSHPGAGYCSTPEDNSTDYLLVEVIRETGDPSSSRGQGLKQFRDGLFFVETLSTPTFPEKRPLTKGTVSHSWRVRINVPELAKTRTASGSGAVLGVYGKAAGGNITNWVRLNGHRLVSKGGHSIY